MDPNATLELIRDAVQRVQADDGGELELADLVKNLDEWITRGGVLPDDWQPMEDPFPGT